MTKAFILWTDPFVLFRIVRRLSSFALSKRIIGWFLAHMSFVLPLQRLRETETLMAFHHPEPAYPLHILLVPKQTVGKLSDLDPTDTRLLSDLLVVVQSLVREFGLEHSGYRLIVNGGMYQDFPLLHFHLVADKWTQSPSSTLVLNTPS
jgi:histidine triad (HIT) family protein